NIPNKQAMTRPPSLRDPKKALFVFFIASPGCQIISGYQVCADLREFRAFVPFTGFCYCNHHLWIKALKNQ
ncbi:MAG: hypothetical protein ACREFR_12385, partial [Limisphaerales bacterium]